MKNSKIITSLGSNNNAGFGGGVTFKALSVAVFAGCSGFFNIASAQDVITAQAQTLGENSYYKFTLSGSQQSENQIYATLYKLNSETAKYEYIDVNGNSRTYEYDTITIVPQNYSVDLKTTEYGTGDTSKYFEFQKNEAGNIVLTEINSTVTGGIKINYDSSKIQSLIVNNDVEMADKGVVGGVFIDNNTGSIQGNNCHGTAIYNGGNLGNVIDSVFINNTNTSVSSNTSGAISNTGTIGDIKGSIFVGNVLNSNDGARGAAINQGTWGSGTINSIDGIFIGNISGSKNYSRGGAIATYSRSTIGDVKGLFYGNASVSGGSSYGGAIDNSGMKIGNITGDFIANYVTSETSSAYGGAISNWNFMGNIKGDFINNYVKSDSDKYVTGGGAIFNSRYLGEIDADNYLVGGIKGNFIGNWVKGSYLYGGAILNLNGYIGAAGITGDFVGNYVDATVSGYGGAIFNRSGEIGDIKSNFIGNYVEGSANTHGGAIYNDSGAIANIIKSNFIGNYVKSAGQSTGGAISNWGASINKVESNFIGNYVEGSSNTYGGAIFNYGDGTIGDIKGNFIGNYVKSAGLSLGGAISNWASSIDDIESNFIGNYVESTNNSYGGAIFNASGTIGKKDDEGNVIGGLINSSFINNHVESATGVAKGGAIYTDSELNIISDNHIVQIRDNYTVSSGKLDDNAIYVANKDATLTFNLKNNAQIVLNDNIDGTYNKIDSTDLSEDSDSSGEDGVLVPEVEAYNVIIEGDNLDSTTFHLFNDIRNADLSLGNTQINTINNDVHVYSVNSLTVAQDTKFFADVDLESQTMDRFTANSYGSHSGKLNVAGMNLLSDAPEDIDITAIYFAQPGLKNNVINGVSGGAGDLPQKDFQTTAYTPIFKYNVSYDNQNEYNGQGDGGYFIFTKGDKIPVFNPDGPVTTRPSGNPSDAYNPAVLATPVATVAAAQSTINETFHYAFEHAEAFTQFPLLERIAKIDSNKYAINSTDFNQNLGSFNYDEYNKGIWLRPYTTFESVNLRHGPKIDAINYGTLIGYDGDFKDCKNGWSRVGTTYVGYNGSQLKYSGVDTSMNGGILGATETWYKGNFWTALTLAAGASVGESRTMYGKEDFTSLMAGLGSKTGYNIEFKEGRYIIQPVMFLSYTFVNTFDYANAAGVKIKSDPAHSIQLNPSVRFIANYKNGWQPYAQVGMVWNVLNESKTTANNVKLPEMSMKPYVEYGLGVQRQWKERFTAFGQAMIRNGGRNGIALTAGFRFALGNDGKSFRGKEKVQHIQPQTANIIRKLNPQNSTLNITTRAELIERANGALISNGTKKIVKQLSPEQKTVLNRALPASSVSKMTSRTLSAGILKSL